MLRALTTAVSCLLLLALPLGGCAVACTSFLMDSPDGPIYGTNLDLFIPGDGLILVNQRGVAKSGYMESTTGETLEWVSEYGSVAFSLCGREFAWGGMNEVGLVISTMMLSSGEYPRADERPPVNDGAFVQYVLDTCGSVEEVTKLNELLRVYERSSPPSHYLFADAGGNCGAIEYRDGEYFCYVDETLPVRALANMPYERSAFAYERGGTRWWWSNPGRSAERVAAAEDRSRTFDAVSDTSAVNYAFGTLRYYVAAPHTRWSIVFDIDDRDIWYRSDQSETYKHIAMEWFDLSCGEPLLMLDINDDLDGDVRDHFVPYDPVVNRELFSTFCERWGISVSEESTAALMRHFDGFECSE